MERTQLLEETRDILSRAGFYVSEIYTRRLSGFDFVARRDDTLVIIKILNNVDALTEKYATELKTLSSVLKASVILIGARDSDGVLENDVIYYRFCIPTLTIKTLHDHLLEGIPLTAYAGPGGLYINIDEDKLRHLRKEKNISLGSFARHVKVSRRSVQMYEEGMNTRIDVAYRIEEFLQTSITQPFDILRRYYTRKQEPSQQPKLDPEKFKDFELEILRLLQHVGYKIIPVGKCPFEAFSKDRENILLTSIQQDNEILLDRAHVLSSLAKIIERNAVLITDRETSKHNLKGTPIILRRELKKIHDPEDVIDLVLERQR